MHRAPLLPARRAKVPKKKRFSEFLKSIIVHWECFSNPVQSVFAIIVGTLVPPIWLICNYFQSFAAHSPFDVKKHPGDSIYIWSMQSHRIHAFTPQASPGASCPAPSSAGTNSYRTLALGVLCTALQWKLRLILSERLSAHQVCPWGRLPDRGASTCRKCSFCLSRKAPAPATFSDETHDSESCLFSKLASGGSVAVYLTRPI